MITYVLTRPFSLFLITVSLTMVLYLSYIEFDSLQLRTIYFHQLYEDYYTPLAITLSRPLNGTLPVIYGVASKSAFTAVVSEGVKGYQLLYLTYNWLVVEKVMPFFYSFLLPLGFLLGSIILVSLLRFYTPSSNLQLIFALGDKRYSLDIIGLVVLVSTTMSMTLICGLAPYARWINLGGIVAGFIAIALLFIIAYSISLIIYIATRFSIITFLTSAVITFVLLASSSNTILEFVPTLRLLSGSPDPTGFRALIVEGIGAVSLLLVLYSMCMESEKY